MKDRLIAFGLLLLIVIGAGVVYDMKYAARDDSREVRNLKQQIADEREAIALLHAEWSLLSRPERIQRLVERFQDRFNLQPVEAEAVREIESLPMRPVAGVNDDLDALLENLEAQPADFERLQRSTQIPEGSVVSGGQGQ